MFNSKEAAKRNKYFVPDASRARSNTTRAKDPLTLLHMEGTGGYSIHKEDPEFFHVNNQTAKAANAYLSYLDEDEAPSPKAVRLFGLEEASPGNWRHNRDKSQLANVKTLGDYMNVKVRNKTFGHTYQLGIGIRQPSLVIAPSEEGYTDYRGKRAGSYTNERTGEKHIANPLTLMGQSEAETMLRFNRLVNENVTDPERYREQMKKVNYRTHGVKEGGSYIGIKEGTEPLLVHHHINHTINNMCEAHDAVAGGIDQKTIDQGKTARFVKCFCPHCIIDKSTHPVNQWKDMQHHEEAARKADPATGELEDPRIRKAYFVGFPVSESAQELGPVGKRCHHRIMEGTKAESQVINHAVRGRKDRAAKSMDNSRGSRRRPSSGTPLDNLIDNSGIQSRVHFDSDTDSDTDSDEE